MKKHSASARFHALGMHLIVSANISDIMDEWSVLQYGGFAGILCAYFKYRRELNCALRRISVAVLQDITQRQLNFPIKLRTRCMYCHGRARNRGPCTYETPVIKTTFGCTFRNDPNIF